MAERRCFSNRIIGSDSFYDLPESAQALYLHLNMAADDDGFVNSAGSIAARIKAGKTALSRLVKERFLLQFGEIYVIKHWRIANSLKNDRLKPLNYPGVATKIWVKRNRAYTDHPVDGCMTLYEMKTGRRMDSRMDSKSDSTLESQPNRTEPNRTEPNRTEPNRTPEADFEQIWMEYPEERRGSMQAALDAFRVDITSPEEADEAQTNLQAWKKSEQWNKDGGQYIPYLNNWLSRGIWKTRPSKLVSDAPRELDEDEIRAIQRMMQTDTDDYLRTE